ncbi:MAG: FAD-dependent oxidoreductase [Anaerolineae bacterium]|nr:FAD-dependent oxidoreductase [Anaerolineae bacterium]
MSKINDVLVIGAGLAGLTAARVLADAGKRVQLLDKSRSVGGRLATRRIGEGRADTGTQFFTAHDPEFQAFVERWLEEGIIFEWSRGWSNGSLEETRDGFPRYAAKDGMNALAKHLAAGLDVRINTEIVTIQHLACGWIVTDKENTIFEGGALVLTPPMPQSLKLIEASKISLDPAVFEQLSSIGYEMCLTALLHVDGEMALPAPGAMQRPHANLSWIADNRRKGISKTHIITIQMGGNYSRALWALPDDQILGKLRVDLEPLMGGDSWSILEAQIKRWRYSRPLNPMSVTHVLTGVANDSGSDETRPLLFAGDSFADAKVEGAFLSGLHGARALVGKMS